MATTLDTWLCQEICTSGTLRQQEAPLGCRYKHPRYKHTGLRKLLHVPRCSDTPCCLQHCCSLHSRVSWWAVLVPCVYKHCWYSPKSWVRTSHRGKAGVNAEMFKQESFLQFPFTFMLDLTESTLDTLFQCTMGHGYWTWAGSPFWPRNYPLGPGAAWGRKAPGREAALVNAII